MKAKFTTLALIALFSAAGTTAALAHEDYSESSMFHNATDLTQSKAPQLRGMQGRPGAQVLAPIADFGEGTSTLTLNQFVPPASPSAAIRTGHSEYGEGTATPHAAHR